VKSNKQSKAKSPAVDDDEFDQATPATPVSKKGNASAAASANKNASNQKNASNKKASQAKVEVVPEPEPIIEEEPVEEEEMFKAIMGSNSKIQKSINKREKAMEVENAIRNAAAKSQSNSATKSAQKGSKTPEPMVFLGAPVDYKPASAQKGKSPAGKNAKKQQVMEEEIDEVPSDLDEIIEGDDEELLEGEEGLEGEEDELDEEDLALLEGEVEDDEDEEMGMQRPPGVLPIGYGVAPDPEDEIIPADENEGAVRFYGRKFY